MSDNKYLKKILIRTIVVFGLVLFSSLSVAQLLPSVELVDAIPFILTESFTSAGLYFFIDLARHYHIYSNPGPPEVDTIEALLFP